MDQLPESKQAKEIESIKVKLKSSSKSFHAIRIGFISAVILILIARIVSLMALSLSMTSAIDSQDSGSYILIALAIIILTISGVIAFATSLSGLMKCVRLLYGPPALRKDILREIYINLGLILGIIFGAILLIKLARRSFFFF